MIFSPLHSVIYGYSEFMPKLEANKYFGSKTYQEFLINTRYIRIINLILYRNIEKLSIDVLKIILSYLKKSNKIFLHNK
jgi:hypothetical protein